MNTQGKPIIENALEQTQRVIAQNRILMAGILKIQHLVPEFGKLNAKDVSDIIAETMKKFTS